MKWITEQSFCNWKNHHPVHFQSLFKALFLVQSNSLMIFFFNHHQLKAKRRNQNDTAGHTSIVSLQKKQKTPQDRTQRHPPKKIVAELIHTHQSICLSCWFSWRRDLTSFINSAWFSRIEFITADISVCCMRQLIREWLRNENHHQ